MIKHLINKTLYGKSYYHYFMYDYTLDFFKYADHISFEILYKGSPPPEMSSVIEFLNSEGMLQIGKYGVNITEKGKARRTSGGYRRKKLNKRLINFSIIIGTISALVTIIAVFCNR